MHILFVLIVSGVVLICRTPFKILGMIVGFCACAFIDGWNEFMYDIDDE